MWSQAYIFSTFVVLFLAQSFAQDCVPLRCNRPAAAGNCRAYIPQYYFDVSTRQCRLFIYTGCGGNVNRFRSLGLCERTCLRTASNCGTGPSTPPPSLPSRCTQRMDTGPCRGNYPRFYFDVRSGTCMSFTYGGCQGNSNNFQTQQSCESACVNI